MILLCKQMHHRGKRVLTEQASDVSEVCVVSHLAPGCTTPAQTRSVEASIIQPAVGNDVRKLSVDMEIIQLGIRPLFLWRPS
jgi:hypothetical protein